MLQEYLVVNASTIHRTQSLGVVSSLLSYSLLEGVMQTPHKSESLLSDMNSSAAYIASFLNMLAVVKKYKSKGMQQLIHQYKLGKLTTDEFLKTLQDDYFPKLKHVKIPDALRTEIWKNRAIYLTLFKRDLKSERDISNDAVIAALLEDAWGTRIAPYDDDYTARFRQVLGMLTDEDTKSLTIISNSNPIDMYRFVHYLQAAFPEIHLHPDLDLSTHHSASKLIQLGTWHGKPLQLAVSYRYNVYKSAEQTQQAAAQAPSTASIFSHLVEDNAIDAKSTTLISHWQGDLNIGMKHGLQPSQILSAEKFFPSARSVPTSKFISGFVIGLFIGALNKSATAMMGFGFTLFSLILFKLTNYQSRIAATMMSLGTGLTLGLGLFANASTTPDDGFSYTAPTPN